MSANTWLRPEKGNLVIGRLLIWVALHLGYHITALFRWPATLYYATFYPSVRRASWRYLTHLHNVGRGQQPHYGMVLAHIYAYSTNILDRIYLLSGRFPPHKIHIHGRDYLLDALKQQKGCIIMGAHIGSFDVLRYFGIDAPVRFRMLMYRRFLGETSRLIETLAPTFQADLIELGHADSMLTTFNALKQGEVVGILADRAHDDSRSVPVTFLGQTARLPAGPHQLAARTGAPVVLVSAIRQKNGSYHIACRRLTDTLSQGETQSTLHPHILAYARWMEDLCEQNPYAWFNFFDFWEEGL
ncbi:MULTISPECIES: LpxL/LpxP family acyltransferase [Bombella]|uniref:Acyltransferase n=2 Tax=Bombella TaxID=1654741 RepID=A0ABT3WQA5_9PROT|nr:MULTISPECIES: acyltransferase [Bombella]MCT6855176.1 acyltransferase [Bombella apis]PHI96734.1 hypothetical protein BG621_03070 [Parasaccharibacter apium]MCX5614647.1 acyltransferase [Bombella saccharophila]MCX5619001.1 acyltransferase [Bombella pollinis]MUG89476.1 acyltransferase [Bombella sp. ESL0385]